VLAMRKDKDPGRGPLLSAEGTVTIDHLADDGLRAVLLDDGFGFAVGALADRRLAIARFTLGGGAPRVDQRRTTQESADWSAATRQGDWLMVDSTPGADGNRSIAFVDKDATVMHVRTFAKDDVLVPYFGDPKIAAGVARFMVLSPSKGTMRPIMVTDTSIVDVPGGEETMPAGSRAVRSAVERTVRSATVVDERGALYSVSENGASRMQQALIPKNLPPELMVVINGGVYAAEDKPGYQTSRNAAPLATGPADRRPAIIGGCAGENGGYCVVDRRPTGQPAWELRAYKDQTVQYRAPLGDTGELVRMLAADFWMLVELRDGDVHRTVMVDESGTTTTYPGHFVVDPLRERLYSPVDILLLPAPSRAAAAVPLTLVRIALKTITTRGGEPVSLDLGTQTVRTAGCAVTDGRIGCPGASDFHIWRLST
jgi:hypothetical protein